MFPKRRTRSSGHVCPYPEKHRQQTIHTTLPLTRKVLQTCPLPGRAIPNKSASTATIAGYARTAMEFKEREAIHGIQTTRIVLLICISFSHMYDDTPPTISQDSFLQMSVCWHLPARTCLLCAPSLNRFPGHADILQQMTSPFPGHANVIQQMTSPFPGHANVIQLMTSPFPGHANVIQQMTSPFPGHADVIQQMTSPFPGHANVIQLLTPKDTQFPGHADVVQLKTSQRYAASKAR